MWQTHTPKTPKHTSLIIIIIIIIIGGYLKRIPSPHVFYGCLQHSFQTRDTKGKLLVECFARIHPKS